jgi:hypothetical protein
MYEWNSGRAGCQISHVFKKFSYVKQTWPIHNNVKKKS